VRAKHSGVVAAGVSAVLIASSASFAVASGVLRSHAPDGIARFEPVHPNAKTTTTTAAEAGTNACTTTPRSASPFAHNLVGTTPKRRDGHGRDDEHDDD
jgi:hypothetical protein